MLRLLLPLAALCLSFTITSCTKKDVSHEGHNHSSHSENTTVELCNGYFPDDWDMKRPIDKSNPELMSIKSMMFHFALDRFEKVYGPIVEAYEEGGELVINRLWSNDQVNANTTKSGTKRIVNMYGGLARHEFMTTDAFLLVACHEIGHHFGGAPKKWGWAVSEGQSDYYATLYCFEKLYSDTENRQWFEENEDSIDEFAANKCDEVYADPKEEDDSEEDESEDSENIAGGTEMDRIVCKRAAMASLPLGSLLAEPKEVAFDTPNTKEVTRTSTRHPEGQCRLDTYFQAALCNKEGLLETEINDEDPNPASCNRFDKDEIGLRPLCWFKPDLPNCDPEEGEVDTEWCETPEPPACDPETDEDCETPPQPPEEKDPICEIFPSICE